MSYLLIYIVLSIVMALLMYRNLQEYASIKDIIPTPYTTIEDIVTFLFLVMLWIPVLLVHTFLFFKRFKLISLHLTIDLSTWYLLSVYSKHKDIFVESTVKTNYYSFLCFQFEYSYKKHP